MTPQKAFNLLTACSLLAIGTSAAAQSNISYTLDEDWSSYTVGSSVIGTNYRYISAGDSKNSATVQEKSGEKFLTIRTYGSSGNYSRVAWNGVTIAQPLQITNTLNNFYSVDIRHNSAIYKSTNERQASGLWSFGIIGSTSTINVWIGFTNANNIFLNLGNNTNNRVTFSSSAEHTIDANSWYRFAISLNPEAGVISYEISQVLANGSANLIWSGDTSDAAFTKYYINELRVAEMQVGRPGTSTDANNSSDFNNFIIGSSNIPETSTVAALMGLGALGAVIARRRLLRK